MVPDVDGKLHHFTNVGLYDGLFVMQDAETKTLWNHITGEALYGPLVGQKLGPVGNLLQLNVKQTLAMDPKIQVAISDRIYFAGGRQFGSAGGPPNGGTRQHGPDPNVKMGDRFVQTLGKEDQRRPRMELGLGVWTGATHRYYPMERIRERDGAFIDQLDGRKVLIFVNSDTNTPAAIYVNASTAEVQDGNIRLDNGAMMRDGVLFDHSGNRQPMERPQQVFSRWYGFALTFPGCEIFGQ